MTLLFAPVTSLKLLRPKQSRWATRYGNQGPRACCLPATKRRLVELPGKSISVEVLSAAGAPQPTHETPIVFLHGSHHAAWCFAPFLNHVAPLHPAYALSLRGHTSEPVPPPGTLFPVNELVDDVRAVLAQIPGPKPVVVAHSMGGHLLQHLIASGGASTVAGAVLMSSVPPGGNGGLAMRNLKRFGLWSFIKTTMGFIRKSAGRDLDLCRMMFFTREGYIDQDVEGDDALRVYMEELERASPWGIDVSTMTAVPQTSAVDEMKGRILVLGGAEDYVVDKVALQETAEFWRLSEPVLLFENKPHDLMLSTGRQDVADAITDWIACTFLGETSVSATSTSAQRSRLEI